MKWTTIISATAILIILFGIAYGLIVLGITGPPAPVSLRELGEKYLYYMLNPSTRYLSAESPEGVTAILWDYRGLDTLYETMVLFGAIIGGVLVYIEYFESSSKRSRVNGYSSPIVRSVSRIVLWLTIIIAIAFGFTGQLTPGGGFVGGAAFAVVPVLLVLVYTLGYARRLGLTHNKALILRATFLFFIIIVVVTPLVFSGYIFQNQAKPDSSFSYPGRFIDSTPLGGSLFLLNFCELFAVAGAFTIAFLLLGSIINVKEAKLGHED